MNFCLFTSKKLPWKKSFPAWMVSHKTILLFAGFLCLSVVSFAQQNSVSGIVTGNNNQPLPGVSVLVQSTKKGTATNNAGRFTIAASSGDVLLFSSIGYKDQTVTIGSQNTITVTMVNATDSTLNDVVVIGYQTVRRKDLTGATGVVNMTDANKVSAASVGEQIQGLVPGVTVRNGGAPGQNSVVEIRGVGSFGSSTPLYVIDGMIADANSTVNTNDIASIQILKDASAAAIYGSRAGNGVIIITTKKGKEGPSKIFGSAKYGTQQIPKTWNVMSAPQFLQTVKQEYANSGQSLPSDVAAQVANNTINTDWQKAAYQKGAYEDYNLGVSGGSKTGNYLISGSYYKNEGTLVGNSFERASVRINTEAKKGILTIGENMALSSTDGKNPGGGVNAFYSSAQMLPIIAVQSSAYTDANQYPSNPGGWGIGSSDNPTYISNYLAAVALDKQTYSYAKIVGNAYAQLNFTSWLSYRFNMGVEASYDYGKEERDTGIWRYTNQPPLTSVSEGRSRFTNFLMEHTLNFNKVFGKHSISGVVGFSRTQQMRDYTNASRTNLQVVNGNVFTTIGSAQGTPSVDGGLINKWRNHGYLGRINYAYADKYLLTLTGRIDQDSRFGPSNRTGYFPSAAVAWRISKEDFFHVSWINDLKIRASYGKLGFSDVLSAWQYIGFINSNPRAVYGTGQTPVIGQYQADITNPDLKWEERTQKNIGLDASLLNNRILFTAEVYNSVSKDVLVNVPLASYLGSTGSPFVNSGSIKNTGVEVSATYRDNGHLFKWDISGNFTTIKNKVLSVGNQGIDAASGVAVNYLQPANYTRSQVGNALGSWYVIQTDGIFQSQDEITNYVNKSGTIIQPNAKPGDIKYIDKNGDGQINDQDRVFRGSPWPTLQAGLQFNASYKQFNINIQFVGVFGNKIYDDVRRALDSYQLTNFRDDISPWTTTNTKTSDPRLAIDNGNDPSVAMNNMGETDRWLESGSYVRLRNVELGYNFSSNLLKSISFSSARFYVSGQNLFTITKYKGLDPDVSNGDILQRGFDAGFWPSSRVFSAGVQFEF